MKPMRFGQAKRGGERLRGEQRLITVQVDGDDAHSTRTRLGQQLDAANGDLDRLAALQAADVVDTDGVAGLGLASLYLERLHYGPEAMVVLDAVYGHLEADLQI